MSTAVQRLTRVFRVSTQTLPDPAPTETPERAFAMLAVGMPALAHYTLDPPVIEGDRMVYPAVRPPVQTKGAQRSAKTSDKDAAEARQALDAWADAPSTAGYDETLHSAVGRLLLAMAKREPGAAGGFAIAVD